jgi:ubiquinone/menaquinone biosynthesis C-methylase UbiE
MNSVDNPQEIKKVIQSFSDEWAEHEYEKTRTWGLSVEQRKKRFLRQMDLLDKAELKGKLLLDAGCGNGELSIGLSTLGLKVVAMDVSRSVYRAKEFDKDKKIEIVRGSVSQPPFKPNSFDIVYSSGVLHHNPDTKYAFNKLSETAKGKYFVWVYKKFGLMKSNKLKLYSYHILNKVIANSPNKFQTLILYAILPVAMLKQYITKSAKDTWREKMILNRDGFTPVYAYRYAPEEVIGWFKEMGFMNMKVTDLEEDCGFGIVGYRL